MERRSFRTCLWPATRPSPGVCRRWKGGRMRGAVACVCGARNQAIPGWMPTVEGTGGASPGAGASGAGAGAGPSEVLPQLAVAGWRRIQALALVPDTTLESRV
eukprot:364574-Chlamydomonas_euryale.AAC.3